MRVKTWLVALVAVVIACDNPLPTSPTPPLEPPPVEDQAPPPRATLPPLTVHGTQFFAGGLPFTWAGVSAFDLGVRLAHGDARYLDWAAETGFTILRVVPASVYRTPRTLDEGIAQLGPLLDAAAARGLYVEVVIGVDTVPFGLTREAFESYARRIASVVNARSNAVIEVANEIGHGTQARYLEDVGVQLRVLEMFTVPGSAGSSHGGQEPRWDAGGYLTHHGDRWLTPEQHGAIIAAAQQRYRKPVVDDEWIGFAFAAQPGRRSADPALAYRQGRAARHYGYGATLHLDAGLDATVDRLDDVQREAARQFIAAMKGH